MRFAQEGATVIVTDRKFEQAKATAKKLGGRKSFAGPFDVSCLGTSSLLIYL